MVQDTGVIASRRRRDRRLPEVVHLCALGLLLTACGGESGAPPAPRPGTSAGIGEGGDENAGGATAGDANAAGGGGSAGGATAGDGSAGTPPRIGSGTGLSLSWEQVDQTGPSPRAFHGMVYDTAQSRVVVFGGEPAVDSANTWVRTADGWSQLEASGELPVAYGTAMAYDSVRDRVVLFGGGDQFNPIGDTWELDGDTWTRVTTATSPSPRSDAAMAFDEARGVTVLFGGWQTSVLGDTWEYDGSDWRQIEPESAPRARSTAAMTYDPVAERILLFGGGDAVGEFSDTWQYDGTDWKDLTEGETPPQRRWAGFVYAAATGQVVLHGGAIVTTEFRETVYEDTWVFGGKTWVEVTSGNHPSARQGHRMVYDADRGRVVLFGGFEDIFGFFDASFVGDTWELEY